MTGETMPLPKFMSYTDMICKQIPSVYLQLAATFLSPIIFEGLLNCSSLLLQWYLSRFLYKFVQWIAVLSWGFWAQLFKDNNTRHMYMQCSQLKI